MSGTPSIMLAAIAGATWVRQLDFSTLSDTGLAQPLGGSGWGAELSIVDYTSTPGTPQKVATATVANNKIAWVAPGVLWVAFPQIETQAWTWTRAGWYLDIIDPALIYDPAGTRHNILRGFITCEPHAPNVNFIAPTQNSL